MCEARGATRAGVTFATRAGVTFAKAKCRYIYTVIAMVGRASPDELLAVATAGTRFASCLLLARILELPHPVNDPSHALARHHRWSRPDRADPCRSPCSLWARGLRHRAQPADRAGAPRG